MAKESQKRIWPASLFRFTGISPIEHAVSLARFCYSAMAGYSAPCKVRRSEERSEFFHCALSNCCRRQLPPSIDVSVDDDIVPYEAMTSSTSLRRVFVTAHASRQRRRDVVGGPSLSCSSLNSKLWNTLISFDARFELTRKARESTSAQPRARRCNRKLWLTT